MGRHIASAPSHSTRRLIPVFVARLEGEVQWRARFDDGVPKGAISEDLGPGMNRISAGTAWRRMRCAVRCSALPRTRPTPVARHHCNIIRQTNLHNFSSAAYYFGAHFMAPRVVSPPEFEDRASPDAWHAPCPPQRDASGARSLVRKSR